MASMPTARRGLSVAADEKNGMLYAVGGLNCKKDCYGNDIGYFDVVEAFSASSGTWESKPPMPTPRRDLGVVVDEWERLWVLGGCGGRDVDPGACPVMATVEIFDPAKGTWSTPPAAQLPEPRHGLLAATDGRHIYVVGGSPESGVFNAPRGSKKAWRLEIQEDLSTVAWEALPDMHEARFGLNKGYGYVVDGKLYAIGGSVGAGSFLHFNPTETMEVLSVG